MTAGAGVVHSEMFPLVNTTQPNPTELFQIWLNLPKTEKMVPPYFTMLWKEDIPYIEEKNTRVNIYAGALHGKSPLPPPPNSWAANSSSDVAIWSITIQKNGSIILPACESGTNRTLYFFAGMELIINETPIPHGYGLRMQPDTEIIIKNEHEKAEILLLQGRPLNEPVAKHGPFVMNTRAEIRQAIIDYQRTGFGGWPWNRKDPVHKSDSGRFAIHADGKIEKKG
jgi:redox-sensitive bicupin YhaK (pirin superfamily)